ncbi:hypothetical protein DID88_003997 [Monilinia fructigena]|uniref:Uncharacterized protein n=1 Tax=Monilinia fructigena TaxID=38457 RepID=A0A395IJH9_9HELO|nr:hypothetical protein DID88_003997 [Monilinia fructigena]
MAGKKKRKRMGAFGSSRIPTESLSLSALPIGNQPERKAPKVEEAQGSTVSQSPMMEDEDYCEKCTESESDRERFLDDDMEFLPTCWGKDDNSNEDHNRAEIARKAKVKRTKIQASTTMMMSAYEKRTAMISDHKVGLSQTLAKLMKSSKAEMEKAESYLEAPCGPAGNIDDKMICSTIHIKDSPVKTTPGFQDSARTVTKSNSQALDAVKCNVYIKRSTIHEIELRTKLIKKMARQDRNLKSAKTQAGSLRSEIELGLPKTHALDSAKSLLKSLNKSTQDFKTGEFRLGVDQRSIAMVQQEVTRLRDVNRRIRKQQSGSASTSTRLQQLEPKYGGLKDDYYALKDKHKELVEDAARYRRERDRYKDDAEYYREKRDTVRIKLESIGQ